MIIENPDSSGKVKVKLLKNIMVAGKFKNAGDVVELSLMDARTLTASKAVEPFKGAAAKPESSKQDKAKKHNK